MDMHGVRVTWLGHGTSKIQTPEGKTILVDPWVEHNPAFPDEHKHLGKLDAILITHAHFDHIGDAIEVARRTQPGQVVAVFETAAWLEQKGVQNTVGINLGGTIEVAGVNATMVHAEHSCGISDGAAIVYGGTAAGYILDFGGDFCLYVAGDTNVFGDMRLYAQLYHPQVAILPIGDFYTMGPREAACAVQLLQVDAVIPAHFATFPALTGTPDALRKELDAIGLRQVEVIALKPGETAG